MVEEKEILTNEIKKIIYYRMCDSFVNYYYCSPRPQVSLPCNNNVPSIYIPQGTVPVFPDLKWEILSAFLLEIKNDKEIQVIIQDLYNVYLESGFSTNLTPYIDSFISKATPYLTKFASKYPDYNFVCTLNEGNILLTFNDGTTNLCIASSSDLLLNTVDTIISFRTSARTAPSNFISAANSNFSNIGITQKFATVAIGVLPIATYNTVCETDLLRTVTGAVLRLLVLPLSVAPGVSRAVTPSFIPNMMRQMLQQKN